MKKIIFLLTALFLLSCSDSSHWYIGKWKLDSEKSKSFLESYNQSQKNVLNMGLAFANTWEIIIKEDSLMMRLNGVDSKALPYTVIDREKGMITLETEQKDLELGRNEYGVFTTFKSSEKEKDNDGNVIKEAKTSVKVYLKRVN